MKIFEAEIYRLFSRKNFLVLFASLLLINCALLLVYSESYGMRPTDYGLMYDAVSKMDEADRLDQLKVAEDAMYEALWRNADVGRLEVDLFHFTDHEWKNMTLLRQAVHELEHIHGYHASIESTLAELSRRSGVSIFRNQDAYSEAATARAIADYSALLLRTPRFARALGFTGQTGFLPTSAFALMLSLLTVFFLVYEDRQIGMERMVLPLAKGRSSLIVYKITTLSISVLIIHLAFILSTALLTTLLYGPLEIFAPLQSIPEFGGSGLLLTIGQYLVLHHLLVYIGLMVLTLIAMLVAIYAPNAVLVFLTPFAVLLASYGLYRLPLETRSQLSPIRFINIYTIFQPATMFETYRQLNVMGTPLRIEQLLPPVILVLLVVLCVVVIRTYNRQTLKSKGKGPHLFSFRARLHTSLWRHETYKLAFRSSGLLLLIILIAFTFLRYQAMHMPLTDDEYYYKSYMDHLSGELNDDKRAYMVAERAHFNELHSKVSMANERLAAGDLDRDAHGILMRNYEEQLRPEMAYLQVVDVWQHLEMRATRGETASFIYERGYLVLLGVHYFGAPESILNAISIFFVLGLALAPFITDERATDMIRLQHAYPRGRGDTIRAKLGVATGCFLCVSLVVSGAWLLFIRQTFGLPLAASSTANVLFFFAKGLAMPLWLLLTVQVLLSTLVGLAVVSLMLLIGAYGKDRLWSMLLITICFSLPLGLRYLGLPIFDYVGLTAFLHGSLWIEKSATWYLLIIPLLVGALWAFQRVYTRNR